MATVHRGAGPADAHPFSRPWLQRRCTEYRDQITLGGAKKDLDDELKEYWPGGKSNPFTGRNAWNYCYAQCIRLLGRHEVMAGDRERALAALTQAARRDPRRVKLSDGTVRGVYPKSIVALAWLRSLRADLVQVLEHEAAAMRAASLEDLKVLTLAPVTEALAYQLWIWIVTHEAPGLPFDPRQELPEPPAWTRDLGHEDLLLLTDAHQDVNHTRLSLILSAAPEEGERPRTPLPLEAWVSAYAHETGADTFSLLTEHSLGELFAKAVAAAIRARESMPAKNTGGLGDMPLPQFGNTLVA